jgi:hypothetical protein
MTLDLDTLTLHAGSHEPDHTFCVMEAVAYIAGEPWSDHPKCASPVITSFLISWNDGTNDEDRQNLKRFIPMVVGTNTGKADDTKRAWMATDWLVRVFTPTWLDKAGMTDHAERLRGLDALTSAALARKAQPIIEQARKESDAARDAARAAAWAAARDAAWAAARAAAWAAARDAAWAAAWDAAWAAAWDAAWAAAWDAAKGKKGYEAQYSAAYTAAKKVLDVALADTVSELRASAEDLLERMIAVGR